MLTRLSSWLSIAALATSAFAVLSASPALAGAKMCGGLPCVTAGSNHRQPGSPGTGGGGNHGGAAPHPVLIPCPADQLCGDQTLGDVPPVQRVPTVDVAYQARNKLLLPAPEIHTSPEGKTYVQLRTGLWIAPGDFGRETAAAQVPGQTVTAIATPKDVTWKMGEGTVTCTTAGSRNGTGCGYTYQRSSANQPGGKYAISATVTWNIYWTCEGVCDAATGNFEYPTVSMTSNADLAVGEVQTESRPG
jgi:hypothetical protein